MKSARLLLVVSMLLFPQLSQSAAADTKEKSMKDASVGFTAGYNSGGDYEPMFGISVFIFPTPDFGFYASYRDNNTTKRDPYYSAYDVTDSNDVLVQRIQEVSLFSAGIVKSVMPHVSVYLGAGYARKKGYAKMKYSSNSYPWVSQPNLNNYYYVNDRPVDGVQYYLDGGILLSYEYLLMQIGRNTLANSNEYAIGFSIDM